MTELTIEQLQDKIIELNNKNEQLETENSALKQAHVEDTETIKQVRSINTKLYQQASFGQNPTATSGSEEPEEHVETKDEFLKSFIDPAKEKLANMYGVKFK